MPWMIFRCGEDYGYLMITVLSQSQPQQPEPPCPRRQMFCLLFLFNGWLERHGGGFTVSVDKVSGTFKRLHIINR